MRAAYDRRVDGLPWLTHGDFAGRVGEVFDVTTGDGDPVRLTLSSTVQGTETGGAGPGGATRQQFSLVFVGPAGAPLAQATYQVVHDELGGLDLFLVPLGPDDDGMRYEAAFA